MSAHKMSDDASRMEFVDRVCGSVDPSPTWNEAIEAAARIVERHSLPAKVNEYTAMMELRFIASDIRALTKPPAST